LFPTVFASRSASPWCYTLSLHDALPIWEVETSESQGYITDEAARLLREAGVVRMLQPKDYGGEEAHPREFVEIVMELAARAPSRSEEHTSELQSRENLVCRLLLEKKKQN